MHVCSQCGTTLGGYGPAGLCPRCMLLDGLGEDDAHRFGDYELIEEIARGGMGVVWKARQLSLNRMVAVKLMLSGAFAQPEFVRRFRTEAEAAASLQHPNIVAIHEIGEHEGQPFFSMDYVEGQNLAQLVRDGPLPARRTAGYLKTIAEAVHYAHEHQILHRDLKPSNILIDAVDQPRITDFGLAKRLTSDLAPNTSDLTLTGQVLGSPNYLPPEQAEARHDHVGPASDVYSLGAVLYWLLTARAPFQAATVADTLHQVRTADPVSPRLLNPSVPRDLDTICLKCLEKEIPRRYSTAQELADELGQFLRNEPIRARPLGAMGKAVRWCKRNPLLAVSLAALLLVFLIGFATVTWQWRRAQAETLTARRNLYAADMNLAQQALEMRNLGRARQLLNRYRPEPGQVDLRGWEWRLLWNQCRGDSWFSLKGHSNRVYTVDFSPDGRWLVSAGYDNMVFLWDIATRRSVATVKAAHEGSEARMTPVLFSRDGRWVFSSSGFENTVWVRSVPSLEPVRELRHATSVEGMALSPDGRSLAVVTATNVVLWTLADGHVTPLRLLTLDLHSSHVTYSRDGRWLAFNERNGKIRLWDVHAGTEAVGLSGHPPDNFWDTSVLDLAFAPEGQHLLSAGTDETLRVWDLVTHQESARLTNLVVVVSAMAFSPDGKLLATANTDQTVKLWQTGSWKELATLRGSENEAWGAAFSPDGRLLATGCKDDSILLWKVAATARPPSTFVTTNGFFSPSLSPDSRKALVNRDYVSGAVVDLENWTQTPFKFPPHISTNLNWIALGPEGRFLAGALADGTVRWWDLPLFQNEVIFPGHVGGAHRLNVSEDGRFVVSVGADRFVRVWDVAATRQVRQFPALVPWAIFVLPEREDCLAVGYRTGDVEVWSMSQGNLIVRLRAHKERPKGLAFLDHPRRLVTASQDGAVNIWPLDPPGPALTLHGSLPGVNSMALSPDKRTLAVGSGDGTVKLWDLLSLQELGTLRGHNAIVYVMGFSMDGTRLVSGDGRCLIRWHAPSFSEIEAAEKADSASLTLP
jgi:eukaryotic-like serine/threonine-protein kinase